MNSTHLSAAKQRVRYLLSDLITGALAFWVFNIVRFYLLKEESIGYADLWLFLGSKKLVIEQCLMPLGMLAVYWLSGYYNHPYGKSRLQELNTTLFSTIVTTVIIYLILLTNDQTGRRTINYEIIIILFGLIFLLTYAGRLCLTTYSIHNFRRNHWHIRVLVVGSPEVSREMARKLEMSLGRVRYSVAGFLDPADHKQIKNGKTELNIDEIKNLCESLKADQIVLATGDLDDREILSLLASLFPLDIPVKISPDTFSFVTSAVRLKDIFAEPFIDLASPSISEASKNIKRAFDVAASLFALIALSPLILFLALCIRLSTPGPVIYRQERIGLHQKPFLIYKFRTMIVDSEPDGPRLSGEDDPRITRCGKWMRKYRLDELPQFYNVLKGEMSIVGPRPERRFFINEIIKEAPYYSLVCQVRPGITSWGMVKYGYASAIPQMVERTRYDLIYLANMSLSLDCKIMLYTLKTIFTGKGM